jgi:hypothetical protein
MRALFVVDGDPLIEAGLYPACSVASYEMLPDTPSSSVLWNRLQIPLTGMMVRQINAIFYKLLSPE